MNRASSPLPLSVGLLTAPTAQVHLHAPYRSLPSGKVHTPGTLSLTRADAGTRLIPLTPEAVFTVSRMPIGIEFHWRQCRDLTFQGALRVEPDPASPDGIILINDVDPEQYLKSVISSEMSPHASQALLRAHAVISRTWVALRMNRRPGNRPLPPAPTQDEIITWWDENDHDRFTVCADDHCQRYQGVSAGLLPAAVEAVDATRGLVLRGPDGALVDARFSKCCGGLTELFSSCWEETDAHTCLRSLPDTPQHIHPAPALTPEQWIESHPAHCFCGRATTDIRATVLNDYDRATTDFFRWSLTATPAELRTNILRVTGRDPGDVIDLLPVSRGPSARITRLQVVGSLATFTIGKELLIRRALSPTCLYSSAFTVSRTPDGRFLLRGAGWGHGVGLCQIGAAVMGHEGYTWRQILAHYYPGATIAPMA